MSSDSSSSDSEAENELSKRVADIEAGLLESPYYYEGYIELIKLLRQQGDLNKAREARNKMRKVFPLTEDLWLEWLNDELPLTGLIAESALEMRLLFESATKDYLSVKVWSEYARFAVDRMSMMSEGVAFPREVFERAVTACGLHVSQSGEIWNAYVEFEKAVLHSLQDMQLENSEDDEIKQQVESQFDKVEKLYKRQLAVAHFGMEEAFKEYQTSFATITVNEGSMPAYYRAKKMLEEYLPFEKQLLASDPPTLESYRDYLNHVTSTKAEPSLINTLYQRAVAHHCLDTQLWQGYLSFLDMNFRTAGAVLIPGYHLAVRNCPWVCRFWLGLVRGMERNKSSHEEIVATFEKSLVDTFSSAGDYLEMWMAYCDYYHRLVSEETSQHTQEELIAIFKRARNMLMENFGKKGDPMDVLSSYQANVERDIPDGRAIWDDIMTRHGRESQYWLDYIAYVRRREGPVNCRKLFLLAVNSASDDPQRVCEAYLQFEREEGTLETFEAAVTRTTSQLERVRERKEKVAEKEAQKKEEFKKKRKLEKTAQKKEKTNDEISSQLHRGAKERSQGSNKESQKLSTNQRKRKAAHVFFKDSDEEDGDTMCAKKLKVENDGGDGTLSTTESNGTVVNSSNYHSETRESSTAGRVTSDVAMETEQVVAEGTKEGRTVFVSNLLPKVTKNDLKERFSECGEIIDIRLVHSKRKANRINTFAYIEFTSPSSASHALSLDRSLFMEKNIYVSPFREKGQKPGDKNAGRMNKSTVFVNNLQKDVKEHQLEELFKECGEVKEVRLVRNAAGRPKGYAYVEFMAESSAEAAVEKLNSHFLGLKKISVAISNPPGSSSVSMETTAMEEEVVVGGPGKKEGEFAKPTFIPRRAIKKIEEAPLIRKSKTNISLMPRVLAKKGGAEEVKEQDEAKKVVGQKLSNEDFRKLYSN